MKKNVFALIASLGLGIFIQFVFIFMFCPFGCPEDKQLAATLAQPISYIVCGVLAFAISKKWVLGVIVTLLMVAIGYLFFGSLPIPV